MSESNPQTGDPEPGDLEAQLAALLAGITGTENEQHQQQTEETDGDNDNNNNAQAETDDNSRLLLEQTLAEVQHALAAQGQAQEEEAKEQQSTSTSITQEQTVQSSDLDQNQNEILVEESTNVQEQEQQTQISEQSHQNVDQNVLNDMIQKALSALGDEQGEQTHSTQYGAQSEHPLSGQGEQQQLQDQLQQQLQHQIEQQLQQQHQHQEPSDLRVSDNFSVSHDATNQDNEVIRIQQELQKILGASTSLDTHHPDDNVIEQPSAESQHVEKSSETEGAQVFAGEDEELAAQRALIEQLTAAIREESIAEDTAASTTTTTAPSTTATAISEGTGSSVDELDVRAMAELLSNSDLENTLTSLLAGTATTSTSTSGSRTTTAYPTSKTTSEEPKTSLSIAETLAISRNNIQKSRELLANRIDPMLSRKGYLHSWSTKKSAPSTSVSGEKEQQQQQQQSLVDLPNKDQPLNLSSTADNANTLSSSDEISESVPVPSGSADSMLAALLLAKQMIGQGEGVEGESNIDDIEITGQELGLNADAMEAVQQALQALGRSLQEEEEAGSDEQEGLGSGGSFSMPTSEEASTPGMGGVLLDSQVVFHQNRGRTTRVRRGYRAGNMTPEDKERIRMDNRERKKRWRGNNSVRNKDNDLRARLHRRAALIFGTEDTPEKSAWFNDEFQKRREKRILREMQVDPDDNGGTTYNGDSFVNNNNSSSLGIGSAQEDLRAALEVLGKTEGLDAGLAETVDSLVKDPQLLKTLMGDLFGNVEDNSGSSSVMNSSSSDIINSNGSVNGSNYTLETHSIKPVAGGGLISSFKIRKPASLKNNSSNGGSPHQSQPQFPSKYPDRGLTSLLRRVGRPRTNSRLSSARVTNTSAPTNSAVDAASHMNALDSSANNNASEASVPNDSSLEMNLDPSLQDSTSSKRKRSTEPDNSNSISAGTSNASPRPPQYFSSSSTQSSIHREDRNVRSKVEDKRVKALGFPPMLAGMAIRR